MHAHNAVRRALAAVATLAATATPLAAQSFTIEKLASDQPAVAAHTDPDLTGAWGISNSPTSALWLAAHGAGKSVIYDGSGVKQALVVTIQGDGSVSGTAYNGTAGAFNDDLFLFVNEDGTFSGWRGALGTTAERLQVADPNSVYKGVAVDVTGGHAYALIANFKTGSVEVHKGDVGAPNLAGNFVDPNLPSGFAPFNVEILGGSVYVAYAKQAANQLDDVPGAGNGFLSRFNLDGTFSNRVISQGALNSPWGLALTPAGFGDLPAGTLLVGNHGDGKILAYAASGTLIETLHDAVNAPLSIPGLFALRFGNGGSGGATTTLYFTATSAGHGLFGDLLPAGAPVAAVPTLSPTGFLALAALLSIAAARMLRKQHP